MPTVGNVVVRFQNSTGATLTRSGYTHGNAVWNQAPPATLAANGTHNVQVAYNFAAGSQADFSASYTMPNEATAFTAGFIVQVVNQSVLLEWSGAGPGHHTTDVQTHGTAPNFTALVTFH